MVKVLRICGYQAGLNTKFGQQDKIEGIVFENRFTSTVGNETAQVWLPLGKVTLSPDVIGKDLYIEYGLRGSVQACQIK